MAAQDTFNPRFYPKDRTAKMPQKGERRYYVSPGCPPIPVLMLDDMALGEWDLGHCTETRRGYGDRLLTEDEVTVWLANYAAHAEFRLGEETKTWTGALERQRAVIEKWRADRG